jgi:hypothetical protein
MVGERHLPHAPAPPRDRLVHRDARQPRGERGATAELRQVRVRAHPRVLDHVFRLGVVAQHRARGAEQPLVVSSHQHLERCEGAGQDAGDDDLVGRRDVVRLIGDGSWVHVGLLVSMARMESAEPERFPGTFGRCRLHSVGGDDMQQATFPTILEAPRVALRIGLGLAAFLAGLDKFIGLLADWPGYLAPVIAGMLPVSPEAFMRVIGVVEMLVGLAILTRWPREGAWCRGLAAPHSGEPGPDGSLLRRRRA